mgnify:CR=1 FL=1
MNGYERIIALMREQGAAKNPQAPRLAEMTAEDKCDIGGMELDAEDLLIADHLKGKLEKEDLVLIQKINMETYAIIERLVKL